MAKDICDVLDIGNASEALRGLDNDERSTIRITEGGPERNIINESGLYSLILRSRKPEAKRFKKWITSEVIPTIRKTGSYSIVQGRKLPDTFGEALRMLADEVDKTARLEAKIEEDAPKVARTDAVLASEDSILIGTLAGILNQNGIDIGQNRLFEYLRENKYLRCVGKNKNLPTQRSLDLGIFTMSEHSYTKPDGSTGYGYTTKVTSKGQLYFIKKFLMDGEGKKK